MTAFSEAWDLLKMPIVPGSLLADGKHPSALFDDPISGERLPLHVRRDGNGLTGYILEQGGRERMNERGTPKREDTRSEAYFSQDADYETLHQDDKGNDLPLKDWRELPPQWTSGDTNTDGKYQRRGYATALYDVIANLVNQMPATASRKFDSATGQMIDTDSFHNEKLGVSDETTREGTAFWRNANKTGKSKDYKWRVRDDL